MNNIEENKMYDVRKMISSFVKNEIGISDVEDGSYKRKTGINVIKSDKISAIVSRGIAIKKIINSISADLASVDSTLKKFGVEKIRELKESGEDIKSVRLASTNADLSVLITEKARSLDAKAVKGVKVEMGDDFSKFFEEKETWTIKDEFVEKCILTLSGTFGQSFVNKAFTKKSTYSIKSNEELDKLLSSELPESLKKKLSSFVKPNEVSITYPK